VQEEGLNITSSNKFENKVNKKYNNSTLVAGEVGNSLVEEEVNMVLKEL
jgi:hypothetical protein